MPFGKPLVALVALLPMCVFEAASLSPDGLAMSGCLLLLALVLRSTTRDTVPNSELIAISGVAVLLLNAKIGYVVLLLLLFMLRLGNLAKAAVCDMDRSDDGRRAGCGRGSQSLSSRDAVGIHGVTLGMAGVDSGRQITYVVGHPFEFLQEAYDTFDQQVLGLDHSRLGLGQMAYGVLGWLSVGLPTIGMWAMTLAAVLFLGSREDVPTTPWQRLILCVSGVVLVTTISAGLYAGWTNVAAPVVNGLQGRYFIPVIPLGLFAIYGLRPTRERAILMILAVAVGITVTTTLVTLLRFYF